jgi:hypothetical protein
MDSRKQPDDADTIASGTIRRGMTDKLVLHDQSGTGRRPSKYVIYAAKDGNLRIKFVASDGRVVNDYSVSGDDSQRRADLLRKKLRDKDNLARLRDDPKVELRERAFAPTGHSEATLRAIERGRVMIEQDLEAAGGTFSTRRVSEHLQISPQAVDKQRRTGKLFAVRDPEGHIRFPAFQFTRPAIRPHLARVLNRLRVDNPFVKLHWLLTTDSRLGNQVPIDLLDRGDVEPVLKAAEAFGEHVPG